MIVAFDIERELANQKQTNGQDRLHYSRQKVDNFAQIILELVSMKFLFRLDYQPVNKTILYKRKFVKNCASTFYGLNHARNEGEKNKRKKFDA